MYRQNFINPQLVGVKILSYTCQIYKFFMPFILFTDLGDADDVINPLGIV